MAIDDAAHNAVIEAILERAASDPAFRRELLRDAREAIRAAFGIVIPPEVRLRFIEKESDVDALVVLPDPNGEGELSEAELDTVAGGVPTNHEWAAAPGHGGARRRSSVHPKILGEQ